MKKIPLLPSYFLWIGLAFILITLLSEIYLQFDGGMPRHLLMDMPVVVKDDPFGEKGYMRIMTVDIELTLKILGTLLGLAFVAFSKTKIEDEMISSIRLYSWSISVLVLIFLNILAVLFFYGLSYLWILASSVHLLLLLFCVVFYVKLIGTKRRGVE